MRSTTIKKNLYNTNDGTALIIHNDNAKQRKANIQILNEVLNRVTHTQNISKKIIAAIDGQNLSDSVRKTYFQKNIYKPSYPFPLSNNEIACFLSHRKAWQHIIDNNLSYAIVFEDDVSINPEIFSESIAIGLNNLKDNQLIRFSNKPPRLTTRLFGKIGRRTYRRLIPSLGAVAYMLNHNTAKHLLELTKTFDRPINTFLQMVNITKIGSIEIYPSGITEISYLLGGSTIQKQKKLSIWQKIKREINRFYYRTAVLFQS